MNTAYLSLGSNEGDRWDYLRRAITAIAVQCGEVSAQSAVYETAAWGMQEQPDFLNMVLCVQTALGAQELMAELLAIEISLGRQRTVKWGSRTIDIDILFFNNEIMDTPTLCLPHPHLQERRFVLAPLSDIAPDYVHPVLHKTVRELLAICPDKLEVHKIKQPHL